MPASLNNRAVNGIPGLRFIEVPLYIPKGINDDLSSSNVLSVAEMKSRLKDVRQTSETIDISALDILKETNDAPEPSQAQTLRSLVASCETDIPKLDAEALRLHGTILDLSQQLAEVSLKLMQNQKLADICVPCLSPIRRLPLEILGEIFSHCVAYDYSTAFDSDLLVVPQVCSVWRKAALAFPKLWATVSLTSPPIGHFIHDDILIYLMELWFHRAKNVPLTFDFYAIDKKGYYMQESHPIIDAAIPFMNRVQSLHMEIKFQNDILGFLLLHVNMLESVYLGLTGHTLNIKASVFDKAPCLLDLGIDNPYSIFDLPWAQLTCLTINGIGVPQAEVLRILSGCDQLVSAFFRITAEGNFVFSAQRLCKLKHLTEFKMILQSYLGDKVYDFFDQISCPALTELRLATKVSTNLSGSSLKDSPQRTQSLQTLLLKSTVGIATDDLLSTLCAIPQLVKLRIDDISIEDDNYDPIIKALTYVEGEGTFLPQLRYLDLEIPNESCDFQFSGSGFVAMLRSRQINRASSPPEVAYLNTNVRLAMPWKIPPQFYVLKSARDRGEIADIHFYSHDPDDDDDDKRDQDLFYDMWGL